MNFPQGYFPALISSNFYKQKPPENERGQVRDDLLAHLRDIGTAPITARELAEYVEAGHAVQTVISVPIGKNAKGKKVYEFRMQQMFGVDIDNDNENEPIETAYSYVEKLQQNGIKASFVYPSYSHTEQKPKFRVFILCNELITDNEERSRIINGLINLSKQADRKCRDKSRYFFGTNKGLIDDLCDFTATNSKAALMSLPLPEGYIYSKEFETDYIASAIKGGPGTCYWSSIIKEGERNDELSRRAFVLLKKYGVCEKSKKEYLKECCRAETRLEQSEENTIWLSSISSYFVKVVSRPDYIRPEIWNKTYFPNDWTDVGQSEIFTETFKDKLLYTPEYGFLYYDGLVYRTKSKEYAQKLAQELTDLQLKELDEKRERLSESRDKLKSLTDEDIIKSKESKLEIKEKQLNKIQGKIESMRNGSHIKSVVDFSKAELTIDKDKFNSVPWELNTPAGVVNLKTGQIREHSSQDLQTKITAVSPSYKNMDKFQGFLRSITTWEPPKGQESIYQGQTKEERSKDLCNYLQVVMGMTLRREIIKESIFFHYGETGANGKSTLISVLSHTLGNELAPTIDVNEFLLNKNSSPFSLAVLDGALMCVCNEPPHNVPLDGAMSKRMASRDGFPVQRKYQDPYTLKPTHTTHMTANVLPKWNFKDKGLERRLFPIPYNARFDGKNCDPLLEQKLIDQCSEAALQWMIDGAVKFHKAGCKLEPFMPECVIRLKNSWANENNSIQAFIDECCEVNHADKEHKSRTGPFNESVQKYLKRNYLPYMNKTEIKQEMDKLGFQVKRIHGYDYYMGIEIDDVTV